MMTIANEFVNENVMSKYVVLALFNVDHVGRSLGRASGL